MRHLCALLLFVGIGISAVSQVVLPGGHSKLPLLKMIRAGETDSLVNIALMNYDSDSRLREIKEYAKVKSDWVEIGRMNYIRDANGRLLEIDMKKLAAPPSGLQILAVNANDKIVFHYDNAGLLSKMDRLSEKFYLRYEYLDGLVLSEIKTMKSNQESVFCRYFSYSAKTGIMNKISGYRVDEDRQLKNYEAKFKVDDFNSFAGPFLVGDQPAVLFNPFKGIRLAYPNNTDWALYGLKDGETDVYKITQAFEYNNAGFPKTMTLRHQVMPAYRFKTGNFEYLRFYYGDASESFTLSDYLAPANVQVFEKRHTLDGYQRIPVSDLFSWTRITSKAKPVDVFKDRIFTFEERLERMKPAIVSQDKTKKQKIYLPADQVVAPKIRYLRKKMPPDQFLTAYSAGDKRFSIVNISEYPLLITIPDNSQFFLPPGNRAELLKEWIKEGMQAYASFPDTCRDVWVHFSEKTVAELLKEADRMDSTYAAYVANKAKPGSEDRMIDRINATPLAKAPDDVRYNNQGEVVEVVKGDDAGFELLQEFGKGIATQYLRAMKAQREIRIQNYPQAAALTRKKAAELKKKIDETDVLLAASKGETNVYSKLLKLENLKELSEWMITENVFLGNTGPY